MAFDTDRYPVPTASPFDDIEQYVGLLLAAVDSELDRSDVWPDADAQTALGYVQDLKAWLVDLPQEIPMTTPIGGTMEYGGDTAPAGWLLCDGTAVSRATYAALFAVIGTKFGVGDGSTTFNLPNLARRSPIGPGSGWAVGQQVGEETHTLTIAEMPAHTHPTVLRAVSGTAYSGGALGAAGSTGSAGGNGAHNNVGPALVMNFIIRALP